MRLIVIDVFIFIEIKEHAMHFHTRTADYPYNCSFKTEARYYALTLSLCENREIIEPELKRRIEELCETDLLILKCYVKKQELIHIPLLLVDSEMLNDQ